MDLNSLSDRDLDTLREVSNIGVGHAANALSQLLGSVVTLDIPSVSVIPIKSVPAVVGGPQTPVVGVYLRLLGESRGCVLLVLPEASATELVSLLTDTPEEDVDLTDPADTSALREVGNILTSAYLNALGKLSDTVLIPSIPGLSYDMAQAVLDTILIDLAQAGDTALVMETNFHDRKKRVNGHFFLMMDSESLNAFMNRLPNSPRSSS